MFDLFPSRLFLTMESNFSVWNSVEIFIGNASALRLDWGESPLPSLCVREQGMSYLLAFMFFCRILIFYAIGSDPEFFY
jgi:hypothetical protein